MYETRTSFDWVILRSWIFVTIMNFCALSDYKFNSYYYIPSKEELYSYWTRVTYIFYRHDEIDYLSLEKFSHLGRKWIKIRGKFETDIAGSFVYKKSQLSPIFRDSKLERTSKEKEDSVREFIHGKLFNESIRFLFLFIGKRMILY